MSLTADEKQKLQKLTRVAGRDRLRVTSARTDDGAMRFGLESRRFRGPVLVGAATEGLTIDELADYLANRYRNRTA